MSTMEKQSFLICSYYTLDTPYQQVVHDYLMPSVHKLGLKSDIRGVQNLGSWQANTSYKSKFVWEMLSHHTADIVFLDGDASVLTYPSLFCEIPTEYIVACHLLDKDTWYGRKYDPRFELLSGTAFFRNSPATKKLVETWVNLCKVYSNVWEQQVLQMALDMEKIKVFNLPIEYCYIKSLPNGDKPRVKVENPVIVHHQVSRMYRNKINNYEFHD